MINPQSLLLLNVLIAVFVFSFVFWRDATREGFSSDKIFDTIILILIFGLLGGKLLFRDISIDYLRYQIFTSPIILEGVLVGGAFALFISVRKNNWSGWKIGDMIAPALAIFQAILFFGFWFILQSWGSLIVFSMFLILYVFIRFLRNEKNFGRSSKFFELKRLNKLGKTGSLISVYLTGSSLIAILFLLLNWDLESKFWRFQLFFYLTVLVISYYVSNRRLKQKKGNTMPSGKISSAKEKFNLIFKRRLKQIEQEKKNMDEKDPFIQEVKQDGFRNLDEDFDEAADLTEHQTIQASKAELELERKEIEKTMENLENGNYGICSSCGKQISTQRLEVYPTAQYCMECQMKIDAKKPV